MRQLQENDVHKVCYLSVIFFTMHVIYLLSGKPDKDESRAVRVNSFSDCEMASNGSFEKKLLQLNTKKAMAESSYTSGFWWVHNTS